MQHIPYKGSAPALTDVMAGNTTFMYDILNTSLPQVRAGRVRAIAVTSSKRSPYVPDIPTMEEAGVKNYSATGSDLWMGVMGPKGIPKPIADKLQLSGLWAPDQIEADVIGEATGSAASPSRVSPIFLTPTPPRKGRG
jgi:tripartite-type tricarboxylate transporter receptor subunit TctC